MSRRRDGLLALVTLTPILAISFATGTATRLAEPLPAAVGVVGTLLVELLLTRFEGPVRSLWSRRPIRVGAVGAVLLVAGTATVSGATLAVPVLAWGLLAYLALLGEGVAREHAVGNGD